MSTSGPTASRKVPMSFSMCASSHVGTISSLGPLWPSKPLYQVPCWPGMTTFVFRAVKPRAATSLPRAVTSSHVSMGGTPMRS